jgi:hypothetical protein
MRHTRANTDNRPGTANAGLVRRIVPAFAGLPAGLMQNPFLFPADFARRYFFSITHCRGCWCLRAKSITCVTLVSAIS